MSRPVRVATWCAVVVVAALSTGCTGPLSPHHSTAATRSASPSSASPTSTVPTPASTTPALPSPRATPSAHASASPPAATKGVARHPSKVLVVIEENHSLAQMRAGMPYLAHLSETYGYATRWSAITHPSEPNYLAIVGGSTFGVTDDRPPSANQDRLAGAQTVFGQALARHETARTYAESMPSSCHPTDASGSSAEPGSYAVRHNPWAFFPGERSACLRDDVSAQGFVADARADALPRVGLLVPNLVHDAHDAPLAEADAWLQTKLPAVLASTDFTSGRLVVVVTADEDDKHSGNVVLTSVLAAGLHHRVVSQPLTHYSLTRFIDQVIGAPPLGNAQQAPDLARAFGL